LSCGLVVIQERSTQRIVRDVVRLSPAEEPPVAELAIDAVSFRFPSNDSRRPAKPVRRPVRLSVCFTR